MRWSERPSAAHGSFSGTWFRRYRRTEMELGRRVSFPRGFKVAARHEPRREWAGVGAMSQLRIATARTIFVADAHRDNGKRFVVRADEKLAAFLELERVTRESLRFPNAE